MCEKEVPKAKRYILDDNHCQKYFKYCEEWLGRMGLIDWDIVFHTVTNKDDLFDLDNAKSMLRTNIANRGGTIVINRDWLIDEPTDKALEKCAVHECGELLLVDLTWMSEYTFSVNEVKEKTHRIINVLEHLLVP